MRARHLILAAVLAATLAACGGGTGAESQTSGQATTAEETSQTAGSVKVARSDLGQILVDGKGMTVYLFTKDSPGVSTCAADCLAAWPPVAGPVTAGDGVDAALLGTVEATDGTVQATYDGWPLYYFAQDAAAGDLKGQGVKDVWYVVAPDGTAVTGAAAKGGGGYGY